MNTKILHTLEFSKILYKLESFAVTQQGKARTTALLPSSDFAEVQHQLQATREATDVVRLRGKAPFGGIRDIEASVRRAQIGGMLNPMELLDISLTSQAARKLKRFLIEAHVEFQVPFIKGLADLISEHKAVEDEINRCIDEQAVVVDQASSELGRIRQELRTNESRVREKLEQILRSTSKQKMLQEQLITIRSDRYVIPVKQEYRAEFGGLIHDQSASGATLFIEPEVIVQLNNKLRELKLKEVTEIEKILTKLTALIAEISSSLLAIIDILAELDFIFAKAGLAHSMKATYPIVNDQGWIRVRRARHPLIAPNEVVPLDMELGQTYTTIIVTGPNTGGKTVTLKTVGLLSLMTMSGLFIPAEEGSHVSIYDSIYADIGDEQSIEQSLSTFSSHMTNIISILQHCSARSLILLDELGAGTDPAEGAALAIAILDHIHQLGCRVIASTHYPELKAYAYQRTGTMNASMEFDMLSLRPTYRLLIGVPGQSNAFAIASRLGLSDEIIAHAREQVNEENMRAETMIASLQENRLLAEQQRKETDQQLSEAHLMKLDAEKQKDDIEAQKQKLLEAAKAEARSLLLKARKEADDIITELRRMASEQSEVIKEHRLIDARRKFDEIGQDWQEAPKTKSPAHKKIKWQVGDAVKVSSLGQKGHIAELVNASEVMVQLGVMKFKVSIEDLEWLSEQASQKPLSKTTAHVKRTRDETTRLELDLRGMNVEEAILETDRFLDEAYLSNLGQVVIIHGKGTGVLRTGIQEFLRKHKHVKSYRLGTYHEGSQGVTVAELNR